MRSDAPTLGTEAQTSAYGDQTMAPVDDTRDKAE